MVANLTRERLLNGTRATIRTDGYSEASVDDFARAAGLTKGAVYSQFESKVDLLLAVIDQWTDHWVARLRRGRQRPFASVSEFVVADAQGEWGDILPDLWRQAVDDETVRERLVGAYHRLEAALAVQIGAAGDGEDPATTAGDALALHDGLVALAALGVPRSRRPVRAEVEQFLAEDDGTPPARRAGTG
jgi:AcrR family transcriptional regulator